MKKLFVLFAALFLASGLFAEKIHEFTPVPFGTSYKKALELLQDNYKIFSYTDTSFTVASNFPAEEFENHLIAFELDKNYRVKGVEHIFFPSERYSKKEFLDKIVNETITDYGLRLIRYTSLSGGIGLKFSDPYDNETTIILDYQSFTIYMTIKAK